MYVTLYDGHVHPGVNMLLGMGKLVGSNDPDAVAAAGKEIQDWAQGASDSIVHLITEVSLVTARTDVRKRETTDVPYQRTQANEQDIQNRMRELEKSLGNILPQSSTSSRIEEIVQNAEKAQVQETTRTMSAAVDANPVYRKKVGKKVFV